MNSLTLVILTFRDGENCLETIKSGLKLTDAEFVVVDCNVEPDWTLREEVLKTVPESRCEYFMFGESSIPQAMNFGLTKSKGHWVWFLNSGDVINDLDILMSKRDLNSKVDLLIGDSKISNEFGLIKDWKYPAVNSRKFSFGMNTYCHQACIFKRSSLDLWNGFPLVDHFDWLTTFYFTTKLETKLISSLTIHYKAGGKSSNESLLSWALTNYNIRRKFRWLFHGNIYSDGVVYIFYIPLRMFLNMLDSRRWKNWWKVGN
jgi:hypothetical protein